LGFHQRLANLIGCVGGRRFWPSLAAFLQGVTPFDSWVGMIFRAGATPSVLHRGYNNQLEAGLFDAYVRELYVLDPFYVFSQGPGGGQFPPGLYRLDEVAPECFRETEYFQRYFVRMVGADEIQFLLPLENRGTLSLSLGRRMAFTDADVGALCLYQPWILQLMRIAALADEDRGLASGTDSLPEDSAPSLEERLRQRGRPRLTDREVQTALLVLAGHSTKGIADELGISPETVKVHRRNLYDKLEVSTQAEMFALFMTPDTSASLGARSIKADAKATREPYLRRVQFQASDK
jgi:DNA-binding CsgD family transcriptional regulator